MQTQVQTLKDATLRVVTEKGSVLIDFTSRTTQFENQGAPFLGASAKTGTKKDKAPCAGCGPKLQQLISGAVGWTKNALGIRVCPETAQESRRAVCENCPSGCYRFGMCEESLGGCGCLLPIKIQDKDEECPHRHWTRHVD